MKKLYTLALAAIASIGAFASAHQAQINIAPAQLQTTGLNSPVKLNGQFANKLRAAAPGINQNPTTKALDTDTWTQMGDATISDWWLGSLFGVQGLPELTSKMYKSETRDGVYKINNPYSSLPTINGLPFSALKAEDMIIHIVGDIFYIEDFNTGYSYTEDDLTGDLIFTSQAYGLISDGNAVDAVINAFGTALFGNYKDNKLTYGPTFSYGGKTYTNLMLSWGNYRLGTNKNGEFQIAMPGTKLEDYTIAAYSEACAPQNAFSVDYEAGADVATVGFNVFKGHYSASADNFQYVAGLTSTQKTTNLEGSITFNPGQTSTVDKYTVFLVTYDAEGNFKKGAAEWLYAMPTDDENWVDRGTYKFTEDFYGSIYQGTMPELDVQIEENKTKPGYYRVVNAYHDRFESQEHSLDHNHYILVDATDPSQALIEESPIGFNLGDGDARVSSIAYMNRINDQPESENAGMYGTVDNDRVLTFPKNSLLFSETRYNNGGWYTANANEAFKLQLPKIDAVGNIAVDNTQAPVEYFNLQGVRIDAPAAGQVIITRQGNKVSKTAVK